MPGGIEDFGILNWAIVIGYVAANLVLGFVLGRKVDSAETFFLGDRTTPWWAIGISVVATYVSALSFLGGPAWAYESGLAVMALHLNYPLVIFAVVTWFLPFFYASGVASIYEYQEKRFGPTSRAVIAGIFLVSQALTSAAILYATALVVTYITGLDVVAAILFLAAVALVYTAIGGITAVIWTDVLQAAVLFVGAVLIGEALVREIPQSLPDTLRALDASGRLDPLDFSATLTRDTTLWAGVIAMTAYHVTVYGANQMMVQRTLAARTLGDAKKSFLLMGYAAFFVYFLFLLLGVLFYGFYEGREFENGNTIILHFAAEYGAPGLMGIIAAAVVAAAMSSLDSSFNSLATVSTVDFYQRYFNRHAPPAHYLQASRWFTVFWAAAIVVPAVLYSRTEGSILETLTKVGSYFVGAKLSMFGLGFFSKSTTERGLLAGVAAGFFAVWAIASYTTIAWPWFCLFGALVNGLVAVAVSRLTDGRRADYPLHTVQGQRALFRKSRLPETEGGWSRVPGRVDRASYGLIVFFFLTLAAMAVLQWTV